MHETAKTSNLNVSQFRWLPTGNQALTEMLQAIEAARVSVRLEMYIFHESQIANQFRQALTSACQRGLRVQVLIDAMGSIELSESFWEMFRTCGGEFRWFNPLSVGRFSVRDHRKVLVCDEEVAFVGGINIAQEYLGDGVESGWRDMGIKMCGRLAKELAQAFDEMFHLADFRQKRFARLRKSAHQKTISAPEAHLLLSAPGRQKNPVTRALVSDFSKARKIQIVSAYFLPTWRLRRTLIHAARRGATVQLVLPGKSDVPLMRLATQSLYRRLLRAGVEIYEYQPQILHAKLIVIDDTVVYAGSANLDIRSLNLNYELLVRLENETLAKEASDFFRADLKHCRRVELKEWVTARTFFGKLMSRLAYFILARLDPYIVGQQLKHLR